MLTGVTGETARCTAFARKAGHTAIIARVTGTAVPTMRNADNEKGRKNYDGCIVHVCPLGMGADGSRGRALKTEMAGSVLSFPRKYARV